MPRTTGRYAVTTTLGEAVRAFVPRPLPPAEPPLAKECFSDLNRQAEALFWQRWKLASEPDPNTWELVTPLDLPFVP